MIRRPSRQPSAAPFSGWRALRIGAALLVLLAGIAGAVSGQGPGTAAQAPVYRVDIDGVINPGALGKLRHAIQTAEANRGAALIVRIDTPGGLLSTTRDMVNAIAESRVPVIAYVGPAGASATSAGAFILLSAHVAAMNAGTNVGASSPIAGDGSDIEGTLGKKIMNDSKAFMRGIAASRGRNAEVAERFVSEAHSLTAREALQEGVIDLVVAEFAELPSAVEGREISFHGQALTLQLAGSEVRTVTPRPIDRLLQHIAHPQIAHMLISLGTLGIYIEILSPGLAFPGVLGVIAVILGLVGIQALPVNIGFLVLLVMGLTLMVAEYFVAGLGVLGIGGAIAFILGSLNLFDAPTSADHRGTILAVSLAVSGALVLTTFLVTRSFMPESRKKRMEGKVGEAMVDFDRSGHVLVEDERWPADTLEPLRHGDRVVVVKMDKQGRLTVRKTDSG